MVGGEAAFLNLLIWYELSQWRAYLLNNIYNTSYIYIYGYIWLMYLIKGVISVGVWNNSNHWLVGNGSVWQFFSCVCAIKVIPFGMLWQTPYKLLQSVCVCAWSQQEEGAGCRLPNHLCIRNGSGLLCSTLFHWLNTFFLTSDWMGKKHGAIATAGLGCIKYSSYTQHFLKKESEVYT